MTPAQHEALEALSSFVIGYQRTGRTRRQFWEEFHARAAAFDADAFADDADPDLRERYFEILADADDAGYSVPDDRLDEVM